MKALQLFTASALMLGSTVALAQVPQAAIQQKTNSQSSTEILQTAEVAPAATPTNVLPAQLRGVRGSRTGTTYYIDGIQVSGRLPGSESSELQEETNEPTPAQPVELLPRGHRCVIPLMDPSPVNMRGSRAADIQMEPQILHRDRGNIRSCRAAEPGQVLYCGITMETTEPPLIETPDEKETVLADKDITAPAVDMQFAARPLEARVWPNPTRGMVYFAVEEQLENSFTVEVFDLTGKKTATIQSPAGGKANLQTEGFSAGVYLYRITDTASGLRSSGRLVVE